MPLTGTRARTRPVQPSATSRPRALPDSVRVRRPRPGRTGTPSRRARAAGGRPGPRGPAAPTSRCSRPGRPVHADWPAWAGTDVVAAFAARGIERPWRHQAAAADAAHAGRHVVLATGTASGKSLAYQLPALTAIRARRGARGPARGRRCSTSPRPRRWPRTSSPRCRPLGLDVRVTTHDGDSRREQRDWARDHGEYVLTNPDMLHRSMLPGHSRWARFLGSPAVRRGRRVPPLPRRVRRPRRAGAAPAAPGLRALRRRADVRARLGDRRRARGRGRAADRAGRPAGHRRRLAARRGRRWRCGSRRSPRTSARTARRSGAPPPPRPPTCSPTWSPRASAPWPSSGPAAAPSRWR